MDRDYGVAEEPEEALGDGGELGRFAEQMLGCERDAAGGGDDVAGVGCGPGSGGLVGPGVFRPDVLVEGRRLQDFVPFQPAHGCVVHEPLPFPPFWGFGRVL